MTSNQTLLFIIIIAIAVSITVSIADGITEEQRQTNLAKHARLIVFV